MNIEVTPFKRRARWFSALVIGHAVCPLCGQHRVKAFNNKGSSGDRSFDYFENHYPFGEKKNLCANSGKMLKDI